MHNYNWYIEELEEGRTLVIYVHLFLTGPLSIFTVIGTTGNAHAVRLSLQMLSHFIVGLEDLKSRRTINCDGIPVPDHIKKSGRKAPSPGDYE